MDALTGSIRTIITLDGSKVRDFGTQPAPFTYTRKTAFTYGTGANNASKRFDDWRTLVASASESLDFSGGGLVDALGDALTFTVIRGVFIENPSTTQILTIGGANNLPGFTTARTIGPGGSEDKVEPSAAGIAVTNAAADLLTIANSAGDSVTYRIIVWGN